jgi:anti-sigma B factor antagonist
MSYLLTERPITPDTQVVAVGGELGLGAAPELEATVNRLLGSDVTSLIVDLTDVTFIDSSGIRVLVSATNRLRATGGSLEIVCTDPNVLRIFEIVGLDRHLSIRSP